MIIIQFLQYLLHYSLSEKNGLCTHTELVAVLFNCSHLTIIQVDNLPMLTYKRLLLLLEVLRIHPLCVIFLFLSQTVIY